MSNASSSRSMPIIRGVRGGLEERNRMPGQPERAVHGDGIRGMQSGSDEINALLKKHRLVNLREIGHQNSKSGSTSSAMSEYSGSLSLKYCSHAFLFHISARVPRRSHQCRHRDPHTRAASAAPPHAPACRCPDQPAAAEKHAQILTCRLVAHRDALNLCGDAAELRLRQQIYARSCPRAMTMPSPSCARIFAGGHAALWRRSSGCTCRVTAEEPPVRRSPARLVRRSWLLLSTRMRTLRLSTLPHHSPKFPTTHPKPTKHAFLHKKLRFRHHSWRTDSGVHRLRHSKRTA